MAHSADGESPVSISQFTREGFREREDRLAVEEPMEIRLDYGPAGARKARSLSVTMRTPGEDFELAAGFLFTEGILDRPEQIRDIDFCGPAAPGRTTSNIVRVELVEEVALDFGRLQRHFFTTSSCGICGKASLDALEVDNLAKLDLSRPRVAAEIIRRLPERLRSDQPLFRSTGGLHAAALIDVDGSLVDLREDVGRHNAVDKLIGRRFLDGRTPLAEQILLVSGRASFEILQKALGAGLPILVAIGAPSSLAVQMAERFDMTLIGFASEERFNLYAAPQRIIAS